MERRDRAAPGGRHPRVLAVAHSYGGAVITNAASTVDNVVGLVYVAAFAPDEGETLLETEGRTRDSVLLEALRPNEYPTGNGSESAVELSIGPASFRSAFAADLPDEEAAIMSATQRPIAEVEASHVLMISHPDAVADVVRTAYAAVS